jgi:hypothetical protein
MKKAMLQGTTFLICMTVSFWLLVIFEGMDFEAPKAFLSTSLKANYTPLIIKNYPLCDPFIDKNMCILKPWLRTILKTDAQKNQYIYVLRRLDELQLPPELALLPILESKYNPYAISPKGAAGVWQLMPSTARSYGILNHQRFELEPATNVALLFLKELHSQFGSWELAIAAYNAGSKRVHDALLAKPSAKHVAQLRLPQATKQYVSSFNHLLLADQ